MSAAAQKAFYRFQSAYYPPILARRAQNGMPVSSTSFHGSKVPNAEFKQDRGATQEGRQVAASARLVFLARLEKLALLGARFAAIFRGQLTLPAARPAAATPAAVVITWPPGALALVTPVVLWLSAAVLWPRTRLTLRMALAARAHVLSRGVGCSMDMDVPPTP